MKAWILRGSIITVYYHTTILPCRTSDVLYNSYSFVLSQSNTIPSSLVIVEDEETVPGAVKPDSCGCDGGHSSHTTTVTEEQVSQVDCSHCGAELGTLSDHFLHFWSSAVTFRKGGEKIFSNEGTESSQDCFKMVVTSFVEQSFTVRPKFLLRNRKKELLLLWVMDKNLAILQNVPKEKKVIRKSVLKILFKFVKDRNVPELHNLECIDLSNQLFTAGLDLLKRSTENLPDSYKSANDYNVSYFDKI